MVRLLSGFVSVSNLGHLNQVIEDIFIVPAHTLTVSFVVLSHGLRRMILISHLFVRRQRIEVRLQLFRLAANDQRQRLLHRLARLILGTAL